MNLKINLNRNIEESFDRIAIELIKKMGLKVNDSVFRFTEIEFYYFHPKHRDNFTHKHNRNEGEWRFHNQGLDITFQSDLESDGGILLRGISFIENSQLKFINGPRKVVGKVFNPTCKFEIVRASLPVQKSPAVYNWGTTFVCLTYGRCL